MASDEPPGLLPPDGVAWPPEPAAPAPAPREPDLAPGPGQRPDDAHIDDWRSMSVEAPEGYRGSATAPQAPVATEPWSVVAFAIALVGLLPFLWSVPLLPVLAVAFGLAGRRACSLDPGLRGKPLATAALLIGAGTLVLVAALVAAGRLTLGP